MKNTGCMTEATAVAVTGPVAEPIAMVLQPLLTVDEDPLLQGATSDAAVDIAAFFERLRKLTLDWRDPFYSGNSNRDETVLASFEIDHDSVDDELKSEYTTFVLVITRLPLAVLLLFMMRSDWEQNWIAAAVAFLVLFCIGNVLLLACCNCTSLDEPTKEMLLARCRHVAIGRDGVYLDDADQSNRNLARRHVIPFAAISTCCIAEVGFLRPSYRVVVTTVPTSMDSDTNRGGGNDKLQAEYIIRGLCKAQAFVDVVQMAVAMKANPHPTVVV